MRNRAIKSIVVGLLIDLAFELLKSVWKTAQKKGQEDVHDCERSEFKQRGGTDQWDLSNK